MRENREGRGGREIVEIVVNSPFVHFFPFFSFALIIIRSSIDSSFYYQLLFNHCCCLKEKYLAYPEKYVNRNRFNSGK